MENKWTPCICAVVMGIAVVVFAWVKVDWAPWALTVAGIVTVICGLMGNKCCCTSLFSKKGQGTCCGSDK